MPPSTSRTAPNSASAPASPCTANPASLGSTFDVDGLRIRVALPSDSTVPEDLLPGLRSAWFKHVLLSDEVLLGFLNRFRIDWLHQCLEAMLLTTAVRDRITVAEAYDAVHDSFDDKLGRNPGCHVQEFECRRIGLGHAVEHGRATEGGT